MTGLPVTELPNVARIDLRIGASYSLSVKYSRIGDITLHNSNNRVNRDMDVKHPILLLTPTQLYLICPALLESYDIDIHMYTKNCGDSLKLKRAILKKLSSVNYKYMMEIDIRVKKSSVQHKVCSKLFYKQFSLEYEAKMK